MLGQKAGETQVQHLNKLFFVAYYPCIVPTITSLNTFILKRPQ